MKYKLNRKTIIAASVMLAALAIPAKTVLAENASVHACIASKSIFKKNHYLKDFLNYIKTLSGQNNESAKFLNEAEIKETETLKKQLKGKGWDFGRDNYKSYKWYQGLNLTMGFNPADSSIKFFSQVSMSGKSYGIDGIHSATWNPAIKNIQFETFIEEINKEYVIRNQFQQMISKAENTNDAIKRFIGFVVAIPTHKILYPQKLFQILNSLQLQHNITIETLCETMTADQTDIVLKRNIAFFLGNVLMKYTNPKETDTEKAVKSLTALLKEAVSNEDKILLKLCLLGLHKIRTQEANDTFLNILTAKTTEKNKLLQNETVSFLTNFRSSDILLEAFRKTDNFMQISIINALGQIGGKEITDILLKEIKTASSSEQFILIENLGHAGNTAALPYLINLLQEDNSLTISTATLMALAHIGGEKAAAAILKKLNTSKNEQIQLTALQALTQAPNKNAVLDLASFVKKSKSKKLKTTAIRAMGETGNQHAIKHLLYLLKKNKDLDIKSAVVEALGQIKNEKATDALIEVIKKHSNPKTTLDSDIYAKHLMLRATAARTLIDIGTEKSLLALLKIAETMETKNMEIDCIKAMEPLKTKKIADILIKKLKNTDTTQELILTACADTLLTIETQEAVGAVKEASYSKKTTLRKIAKKALSKKYKEDTLLKQKTQIDWELFGISSQILIKGYLATEKKHKEEYRNTVHLLFGKDSLDTENISWKNHDIFLQDERYFPLRTDDEKTIERGIQLIYGYLKEITFDSDVKLGEEHEIVKRNDIPSQYYDIFPAGNDENEIITYPTHPLYQKVFSQHIPSEKVGVHRTVEQKVDKMDAHLITMMCQIYSKGTKDINMTIGTEINPSDTSLWTVRYDDHVKVSYTAKKELLQTTDWKNHTSGTLMWYFMNYADKFPLKWMHLRDRILKKLSAYDVDLYDYDENGNLRTTSIYKKNKEGETVEIPLYQYNLTKIPDGKDHSVMRLIINDQAIITGITDMITETTENLLLGRKELKQLMAYEALQEVYTAVAMGEIPDSFAKYRKQAAIYNALKKTSDIFSDYAENKQTVSAKQNEQYIAGCA